MKKTLLFLLILFTTGLQAQDLVAPNPSISQRKLWQVSLASLTVANVLDVQSSWGKHELNSTLAGANGTFGMRGASTKSAFLGGLMGLETLVMRRCPNKKLYRILTVVNFGATAMVAGTAMHNYTIPRY
jgi:hypothetical protein